MISVEERIFRSFDDVHQWYLDLAKDREASAREFKQWKAEDRERREASAREFEQRMQTLDAKLDKIAEEVGGISNNNGIIAEEYFAHALEAWMQFAGQQFDFLDRNLHRIRKGLQDEFDIVMYNGISVALIEVKYKAHEIYLYTMVTKKAPNFRALFPQYKDYKLYLGIASMAFYDELITKANDLGIGIIRQQGDSIEVNTDHIRAY